MTRYRGTAVNDHYYTYRCSECNKGIVERSKRTLDYKVKIHLKHLHKITHQPEFNHSIVFDELIDNHSETLLQIHDRVDTITS